MSSLRFIWGHLGSFQFIYKFTHLSSFRPILSSYKIILNKVKVFLVCSGSFKPILSYLDSFRLIWAHLDSLELINPIQDGLFRGCSRMGLLPKTCHTYPTMMKLGTVILYPRKIQKIYESRDTLLEFCWHQHFFTGNQQILLYQEIQI